MSIGATNNTNTSTAPVSGTNSPSYHGNNVNDLGNRLKRSNVFDVAAAAIQAAKHPNANVQAGSYIS
jgi:hypothetical protein